MEAVVHVSVLIVTIINACIYIYTYIQCTLVFEML